MLLSLHRRTVALVIGLMVVLMFFMPFRGRNPLSSDPHDTMNPHSLPKSDPPSEASEHQANPIPVIFPEPFEHYKPKSKDKFLAYLPHSGFHNQRIELENALLLAAYLKRTLLVPLVYLGDPPVPWLRFEKMYERLLLQNKRGLEHCVDFGPQEPLPVECLNHWRWTRVPWTFFYDLSAIEQTVPIVFRNDLNYEWLMEALKLKWSDIYFIKDMSPYDFRVYDLPESDTPLQRYTSRLDLAELEAIEQRVIHFGSVFGTYRVLAQTAEHSALHQMIRSEMIFHNPVLTDTTTRIVQQLGGIQQFVGLHIRVSDGIFRRQASIHIDDIYHTLVDQFTDLTVEQLAKYDSNHDQDRQEDEDYEFNSRVILGEQSTYIPLAVNHTTDPDLLYPLSNRPPPSLKLACQKPLDRVTERFQNTVIYIATDAPNPRTNPLLRKIFDTFPCTFTLSDFTRELDDLKRIEVMEEKVKLESYLIPMLDAMVSAQGHTFFGTPLSTFSSYIQRQLHPVYTNKTVEVMSIYQPMT